MILEGGQSAEGLCFCGWRKEGKMDGWMDGWIGQTLLKTEQRSQHTRFTIVECGSRRRQWTITNGAAATSSEWPNKERERERW